MSDALGKLKRRTRASPTHSLRTMGLYKTVHELFFKLRNTNRCKLGSKGVRGGSGQISDRHTALAATGMSAQNKITINRYY